MAQGQITLRCWLLAGQGNNCANLLGRERRRSARTRRVGQALSNRRGPSLRRRQCHGRSAPAMQPVTDGLGPNAELACDLAHAGPASSQQDHLGAFRQLLRRAVRADQAGQRLLIRRGYHDRVSRQTWHRGPQRIEGQTDDAPCHARTPLTPPNGHPGDKQINSLPHCGNPDSPLGYGVATFSVRQ